MSNTINQTYYLQVDSNYRDIQKYPNPCDFGVRFKAPQSDVPFVQGESISNTNFFTPLSIDPDYVNTPLTITNGYITKYIEKDDAIYFCGIMNNLTGGQIFSINYNVNETGGYTGYNSLFSLTGVNLVSPFISRVNKNISTINPYELNWISYINKTPNGPNDNICTQVSMDYAPQDVLYFGFEFNIPEFNLYLDSNNQSSIINTVVNPSTGITGYNTYNSCVAVFGYNLDGSNHFFGGRNWGYHIISSNFDITNTQSNGKLNILVDNSASVFVSDNINPYIPNPLEVSLAATDYISPNVFYPFSYSSNNYTIVCTSVQGYSVSPIIDSKFIVYNIEDEKLEITSSHQIETACVSYPLIVKKSTNYYFFVADTDNISYSASSNLPISIYKISETNLVTTSIGLTRFRNSGGFLNGKWIAMSVIEDPSVAGSFYIFVKSYNSASGRSIYVLNYNTTTDTLSATFLTYTNANLNNSNGVLTAFAIGANIYIADSHETNGTISTLTNVPMYIYQYTIGSPGSLTELTSINTGFYPQIKFAYQGATPYLYIGGLFYRQIFDISTPSNPNQIFISQINSSENITPFSLIRNGDTFYYVANGLGYIYNSVDPTNLYLIGQRILPTSANFIYIDNQYMYGFFDNTLVKVKSFINNTTIYSAHYNTNSDARIISTQTPSINGYFDMTTFTANNKLYCVILTTDGIQIYDSSNIQNVFLKISTDPFDTDAYLNKIIVAINGEVVYYFVLKTNTTNANDNKVLIFTSDLDLTQLTQATFDADVIGATVNYFTDINTFITSNNELYLVTLVDPFSILFSNIFLVGETLFTSQTLYKFDNLYTQIQGFEIINYQNGNRTLILSGLDLVSNTRLTSFDLTLNPGSIVLDRTSPNFNSLVSFGLQQEGHKTFYNPNASSRTPDGICIDGNYYLVFRSSGTPNLFIYDVSDSNNLVLVSTIASGEHISGLPIQPTTASMFSSIYPLDIYINPTDNQIFPILDNNLAPDNPEYLYYHNITDINNIINGSVFPAYGYYQTFSNPMTSQFIRRISVGYIGQNTYLYILMCDASGGNFTGNVYILDITDFEFATTFYRDINGTFVNPTPTAYSELKGLGIGFIHQIGSNGTPLYLKTIGGTPNDVEATYANISSIAFDNTFTYIYYTAGWLYKVQTIDSAIVTNQITSLITNYNSIVGKLTSSNGISNWMLPIIGDFNDYIYKILFSKTKEQLYFVMFFESQNILLYEKQPAGTLTNPSLVQVSAGNSSLVTSILGVIDTNGLYIWHSDIFTNDDSRKVQIYSLDIDESLVGDYRVSIVGISDANIVRCRDSTLLPVQSIFSSNSPVIQSMVISYTYDLDGLYKASQYINLPINMSVNTYDIKLYSQYNKFVIIPNICSNIVGNNYDYFIKPINKDGSLTSIFTNFTSQPSSLIINYLYNSFYNEPDTGLQVTRILILNPDGFSPVTGEYINYRLFIQGPNNANNSETIVSIDPVLNRNFSVRTNFIEDGKYYIILNELIRTGLIIRDNLPYLGIDWQGNLSKTFLSYIIQYQYPPTSNVLTIYEIYTSKTFDPTIQYYIIFPYTNKPVWEFFTAIAVNSNGQYIVTCTSQGHIYVSNDFGLTFIKNNTFELETNEYFTCIDISTPGDYITAGTSLGHIYNSNNSGITFTFNPTINLVNEFISSISLSENTGQQQLAGTNLGNIYYSTNFGANWILATSVTPPSTNLNIINITNCDYSFSTRAEFAINARQIYKSINSGADWTEVTNINPQLPYNDRYIDLTSDGSGLNVLVTTFRGQVYYSSDRGVSFVPLLITDVNPPLIQNEYFNSINTDILFNSIIASTNTGKIYTKSLVPSIYMLEQRNFIPVNSDELINSVHVDDTGFNMYITTNRARIYRSIDAGLNWSNVSNILPTNISYNGDTTPVLTIAVVPIINITYNTLTSQYLFTIENLSELYTDWTKTTYAGPELYIVESNPSALWTLPFYPCTQNQVVYYNITISNVSIPNRRLRATQYGTLVSIDTFPYIYLSIWNADDDGNYDPEFINNFYSNNPYKTSKAIFELIIPSQGTGNFAFLNTTLIPRIKFTPNYLNLRFQLTDPEGNILLFDNTPYKPQDAPYINTTVPDSLIDVKVTFTLQKTLQ